MMATCHYVSRFTLDVARVTLNVRRQTCDAVALLALCAIPALSQTQLVIVSGIGGDPRYTRQFGELSAALAQAAHEKARVPDTTIVWLGDTSSSRNRWFRGASSRENIERTLSRLAARPGNDPLVLVLVGHGSGEGAESRISLPGLDVTAADFARMLERFGTRRVAFVNLTSASGDMLPVLASPTRVVITATKSSFQRNESQFGRFFVDAFAKEGADTDKDARISLLEAFRYAEAETKRFYETDNKLSTETSQIADAGQLAARFFLGAAGAGSMASGRLATLYGERTALDGRIEALKRRKSGMTTDAYYAELETILLELARKSREIRTLERGS
jgi:hypothetical protein